MASSEVSHMIGTPFMIKASIPPKRYLNGMTQYIQLFHKYDNAAYGTMTPQKLETGDIVSNRGPDMNEFGLTKAKNRGSRS